MLNRKPVGKKFAIVHSGTPSTRVGVAQLGMDASNTSVGVPAVASVPCVTISEPWEWLPLTMNCAGATPGLWKSGYWNTTRAAMFGSPLSEPMRAPNRALFCSAVLLAAIVHVTDGVAPAQPTPGGVAARFASP